MEEKNMIETNEPVAKKTVTLPNDQVNIAAIAVQVATNWRDKTQFSKLSLSQITVADFVSLTTRFFENVSTKKDVLGHYSRHTKNVKELSKEVKLNGKVLKDYLYEQFKKDAKTYYTEFGFVRKRNGYYLPVDYDNLAQSLRTICDKINSPQYSFLQNKTFGKTYWETTRNKFQTDWDSSRQQASNLSDLTKLIEKDFIEVKKILTLLRRRIKDDFAPKHEMEWRSIGLLKESF